MPNTMRVDSFNGVYIYLPNELNKFLVGTSIGYPEWTKDFSEALKFETVSETVAYITKHSLEGVRIVDVMACSIHWNDRTEQIQARAKYNAELQILKAKYGVDE